MAESSNESSLGISRSSGISPISGDGQHSFSQKHGKKKKPLPEEVKDRFATLSKAVEEIHLQLAKSRSPYRFCVYQENGEVFIDIVRLDEKGKIASEIKKNITHEEFIRLLQNIQSGEGMLFDGQG